MTYRQIARYRLTEGVRTSLVKRQEDRTIVPLYHIDRHKSIDTLT